MKSLKNTLVALIITVALASCKNKSQPEIKTVATVTEVPTVTKSQLDPNATYAKAEFTIEGMTCQIGCANTIQKELAKMDGVKSAKVDFESKLAMVEFDDSKQNLSSIETTVSNVADAYQVKNIRSVNFNEASGETKAMCNTNCTKACCKDKSKADKTACSEDCKKACCVTKT